MTTASRRSVLSVLVLSTVALAAPFAALSQTSAQKHGVVFQVSDGDPQKWNLALNNVNNALDDLGEGTALEIVVYGPGGIAMVKADSVVAKRVEDALKRGVKIVACENTMKAMKLVPADMLPNIGFVKSGVVELIAKQQAGYAYIRP